MCICANKTYALKKIIIIKNGDASMLFWYATNLATTRYRQPSKV
jgi:hypothetical protein